MEMIRIDRGLVSQILFRTLPILVVFVSLTHASAQLNSNEPCSQFVQENRQAPFRSTPTSSDLSKANLWYSHSIVITAHDHCYATHDFADMKSAGITVRTIKLTSDNNYWSGGDAHHWPPNATDNTWRDLEGDFSQPAADAIKILQAIPDVQIIHSVDEIRNAKKTGKLGVIVSFEGGAVAPPTDTICRNNCEDDHCLKNVRVLYE